LLSEWLPDTQMQAIAAENNLSETAFIIEREQYFDLRWLTPRVEVDLCGHATLAAAHIIFHHLGGASDAVSFQSLSKTMASVHFTSGPPAMTRANCAKKMSTQSLM
jgi:PhzF family phenazine biosynthesis protein